MKSTIQIIATLILLSAGQTYAQYFGPVPFLNYPVSAQALGMGGVGTAFVSDNATATIANPAQLGIFSMSSRLNAATDIAGFLDPHQPLDFSAVNVGTRLNRFWPQLPIKASLGIGYSNVSATYFPQSDYPLPLAKETSQETSALNSVSAGVGFDYFVRVGLGYTLKWINNVPAPYSYYPVNHTAEDFGALLQIPITSLVRHEWKRTARMTTGIEPRLDLNIGYAMRNIGSYMSYGGTLPTEADLGWSIDAGLRSEVANHPWQWLSVAWSEQAGTPPISTDSTVMSINPNGTGRYDTLWNYYNRYEKGLGRFNLWQNLIIGRASASVGVSRGGQIGLGEFVYIRAGSFTESGWPTFSTFGWGLRLDGLIKCLMFFKSLSPQSPVAKFLLNHVDLEYDLGRSYTGESYY